MERMNQNETLLSQLDRTIECLGDDSAAHPPRKQLAAEESLIRTYAPKNLEAPFQDLYSILYPCLRPRQSPNEEATTASAILMGPRGCGKSLLVDRCLAACQDAHPNTRFRKVMVNGILVRGEDVPSVVYEIIRQLSDIALHEHSPQEKSQDTNSNSEPLRENLEDESNKDQVDPSVSKKRRRILQKESDEYLLRLRKSTFISNLALLESTFKMAEVDKIPIVLVLDELDAFILNSKGTGGDPQQHRQILLYHLLDRVATPGSNLTLIGLTSNFTALTQMEKRIRSRAEGTSKIVYVRPPSSYEQLLQILHDKLQDCPIGDQVYQLLCSPTVHAREPCIGQTGYIAYALQREFSIGRDVRWFCQALSAALSLYRLDYLLTVSNNGENKAPPSFTPDYLMQSLAMMGALSLTDVAPTSSTRQSNISLVDGVAVDPRLQASLLDLTQPQIVLLLAAKRILGREAHLEQGIIVRDDKVGLAPLTLQRMLQEYRSFRRGIQGYSEEILTRAAIQLLERGVLVPSLDHSGGGPLQYNVSQVYETLDHYSLLRLPLHLPISTERELEEAVKRNLLKCSTALQEWGRRIN